MNIPAKTPASENAISIEDARGKEVLPPEDSDEEQLVIAADAEGNSLTLLEEYAKRREQPHVGEIVFSFICAAASLAFAALIHINTQ